MKRGKFDLFDTVVIIDTEIVGEIYKHRWFENSREDEYYLARYMEDDPGWIAESKLREATKEEWLTYYEQMED